MGLASDREGLPTPNYATSAKILGVTLRYDHKPCDALCTRATDIITAIARMDSLASAPTCTKISVANAVLFPRLEFGLWPLLPFSKTSVKEAEDIDLRIVMWILGFSYRYSKEKMDYHQLCTHLGILPLMERLWVKARKAGYKRRGYLCTTQTTMGPLGHVKNRGPLCLVREGIVMAATKALQAPWTQSLTSVAIAATKEAAMENHDSLIATQDGIVIYTTGSKQGPRSGSGVVIQRRGHPSIELRFPNKEPEHDGLFHAELKAITAVMGYLSVSRQLLTSYERPPSIIIFTDSQAAAIALSKAPKWQSMDPLTEAHEAIRRTKEVLNLPTITLVWVPCHQQVEGSKRADACADCAARYAPTLADGVATTMTEAYTTAWARARKGAPDGLTISVIGATYHSERGSEYRDIERQISPEQARRRVRWTGGYVFSRASPPATCPACGQDMPASESSEAHLLLACPALAADRRRLQLFRGEDDADNWLHTHANLDEYLALLQQFTPSAAAAVLATDLPQPDLPASPDALHPTTTGLILAAITALNESNEADDRQDPQPSI